MKRMWAEWRMSYMQSGQSKGCLFCNTIKMGDRDAFVLERTEHSFMMLNAFPYNSGHVMVAPSRHVRYLHGLREEELLDLTRLVAKGEKALRSAYKPQGLNIGMNLGKCAGAGVPGHLHVHIVPRWDADTNFMPVIGETKVMPESLPSTMRRIKAALRKIGGPGARKKRGRK
ncbi:MAG: HIT domain-containing protein [Candidatus Eisenbacteria bacterium]|nr:HIT domain-containing protein [Candidatus Eisenbacteria bacterium]